MIMKANMYVFMVIARRLFVRVALIRLCEVKKKRQTMRLSAQQSLELHSIKKGIEEYINADCGKGWYNDEVMDSYKVKLENMFSDTDIIDEKSKIITGLLIIGNWKLNIIHKFISNPVLHYFINFDSINDHGRHTEMALKIAPKNAFFNSRHEKNF